MEQGNRDTGWNSRGRKERAMGRETGQRGREKEKERCLQRNPLVRLEKRRHG